MITTSVCEALIVLAIISLNFTAIICFKNKIVVIAALMIANLTMILLYSTIIADYQILQELIIATVFYALTTLILISNAGFIIGVNQKTSSNKPKFNKSILISRLKYLFIAVITVFIGLGSFYLASNNQFHYQTKRQIKKLNINNIGLEGTNLGQDLESKVSTNQKSLEKNILFKRSTDAILIMVGAVLTILLYSNFWKQKPQLK